jgi:hypothetical protein
MSWLSVLPVVATLFSDPLASVPPGHPVVVPLGVGQSSPAPVLPAVASQAPAAIDGSATRWQGEPAAPQPVMIGAAALSATPPARPGRRRSPGSGLSLTLGAAFGGADFVKATDSDGNHALSAGSGAMLGIGGMLTPLWVGERVGFGLGLDGAIKYNRLSAAEGRASLTRYPVTLTAHVLTNVSAGIHYLIIKGGVTRDFGVNYSLQLIEPAGFPATSGFPTIDGNVSGTWGPTGAIGYYKRSSDVLAWDIIGFFSLTKHLIGTEQISANAFGVSWGLHWRP